MYHRIVPITHNKELPIQAGMYVNNNVFEKQLIFLKKFFTIIPLKDLSTILNEKQDITSPKKPFCSLTFDDGWIDFASTAYPILLKHQVPATVFLPTNYIGSNNKFWTDELPLLLKDDRVKKQILDQLIFKLNFKPTYGLQQGDQLIETIINFLKRFPVHEINNILGKISPKSMQECDNNLDRVFITWEEAAKLKKSNLISFGSHTDGHQILTTISKKEIEYELALSKQKLLDNNLVTPEFIPFCYPNGNYSNETKNLVKKAGYSLAVTTKRGWINADSDLFSLNRIGLHNDVSSTIPMLACRLASIF